MPRATNGVSTSSIRIAAERTASMMTMTAIITTRKITGPMTMICAAEDGPTPLPAA